jgi:hypothetical protein
MDGFYPDEFSKIALALTSAQMAKKIFIEESGIGEDLAFNFIGWKESKTHERPPGREASEMCVNA